MALKGSHISEETKRKMSEANKGKIPWSKGKHLSEEHKQKISETEKGRHLSEETKKKMSEAQKRIGNRPPLSKKGTKLSEAHKRKIWDFNQSPSLERRKYGESQTKEKRPSKVGW